MTVITLRAALAALLGATVAATALAQTAPIPPSYAPGVGVPAAPATVGAPAQAPAAAAEAVPATGPLAPLAWLEGCWSGTVNQRDFREHWMPLRGDLLLGTSHTVMAGKTLDFEYLRLDSRPDGVYYVAIPAGKKETAFKLTETISDQGTPVFVFSNPAHDFPQKISYRRGPEGWLYATVEGKVGTANRQVIYPMRRVDCESGDLIKK